MRLFLLALFIAVDGTFTRMLNGRPPGGFLNGGLRRQLLRSQNDDNPYPSVIISNFSQKLDHFNPIDNVRWNQRYFYNPTFADRSKSSGSDLIFFMIGGESKENPKWVGDPTVQYLQWAAEFGAHVFDLEHRFFGDSRPTPDMTTESLQLLTTEQALEDLAYFINFKNKEMNFTNPRWVTFGGSYPGSLSAFFRSKYPELTIAAVASSAPLNLKLDFYEYADVVQSVVTQTTVANATTKCDVAIKKAMETMQSLSMTEEGRKTLNLKLHLDPPFDASTTKADINNLFANLYNVFQGMIQYTYDGSSDITKYDATAQNLCNIMTKDADPVDNMWELAQWYNKYWNGEEITTFANNYTDMIDSLSQTDYDVLGDEGNSMRGWMWLCCNEIGFMQTTDGDSIFGEVLPMNYFYDMCSDMFGPAINASHAFINNQAAIGFYGGETYFDATNLCLPNGLFDPWHALGYFQDDADRNLVSVSIDGAAHCSDMYPAYDGEPAALPAARQKIHDFLSAVIYNGQYTKSSSALSSLLLLLISLFGLPQFA